MEAADTSARDGFVADLSTALHTADSALVAKSRTARLSIFGHWTAFCAEYGREPSLGDLPDQETRLCYLLVFALRVRRRSGKTGKPVRAGTVEAALLAVGSGIAALGVPDPRKEIPGADRNHPLLASFLKTLLDEDDPTTRAHPANVTIIANLHTVLGRKDKPPSQTAKHTIDLCIIGFYWLLRPAEYLAGAGETRSSPFRLKDITFLVDARIVAASDTSLNDLDVNRISRATLTFDDQKNAVRGEQISHASTDHPLLCPCKALARICHHLRTRRADPQTPIYAYYDDGGLYQFIGPSAITRALRASAKALQPTTGINPAFISARSLRPGGATALLCSGVDKDVIQLLGRWKSDAMLRYLRVDAHANNHNFAQRMLAAGHYTFTPRAFADENPQPVPIEAPQAFVDALHHEEGLSHS